MKHRLRLSFLIATASLVFFPESYGANHHQPTPLRRSVPIERSSTLADGVALFVPEGYKPAKTPSLAFAAPLKEAGELARSWQLVPQFFQVNGRAGASLAVPKNSSLYGTGEVTGPLLRNGKSITLWNTDAYGYGDLKSPHLYQSHPWVLGVRPDGSAFGVIFDTTWKSTLSTKNDRILFSSEGGAFRVVVIDRDSPQAVMRSLSDLIGKIPLPPEWSLGFNQCRYSYYPDAKVRAIADEFRNRKLPCDVIWLDIHYMDGYRIFTYDPKRFPDPRSTNDYLHEKGFHSVWIIDPGVRKETGYKVYDSGNGRNLWVENREEKPYVGKVWPGECVFPDFTMPATRKWWAGLYKDFVAEGGDGIWNDMNEPAVFDGPGHSMPTDNHHRGGGGLPPGPHLLYHNVYGMLMVSATRKGLLDARPEKRPFVLTRANYLGGQRYAATWTGDNVSAFGYLKMAIPMSLNLSLSGQPLNGPDIGGYSGGITPDLYGKWISMAPFFPFSRAHTSVDNPPREPWTQGPKIEKVAQTALDRRYRLLPYLYTCAYVASTEGQPIMQPLFFADPKDPALRAEEGAFLLGPDLMIQPHWVESPKIPHGIWRSISLLPTGIEGDGYQAGIKIRGGAIVPLGKVIQSTREKSLDPLTLLVCLDEKGEARGELYEDAGDGFSYTNGDYALTHYHASKDGKVVIVSMETRNGQMRIPDRQIAVELVTTKGVVKATGSETNGVRLTLQ